MELEFVDEKKLAAGLDVSVATVRRWRSVGQGPPFVKLGKSIRYKITEVAAWAEEQYVPRRVPVKPIETNDPAVSEREAV